MSGVPISVVVPSYRRESVLVETVRAVLAQCEAGDEIVVVDQTPRHESATARAIEAVRRDSRVRWYRKARPSIPEAMNAGALLARNEVLLFLDDDVVPAPDLLEVYRSAFAAPDRPHAVNGQVLQPWHVGPVERVRDFGLGFDFAYAHPAEIVPLATGNCALLRATFLDAGGLDETYRGGAYRCDADLGHRLFRFTKRPARFEPRASVRHLQAGGGTRAHGAKDSWASLASAIGDHYFGLRWLGVGGGLGHSLYRAVRAPLNRATLRRPWRIPSLALREAVAFARAAGQIAFRPPATIRDLGAYHDLVVEPEDSVGR